MVRICPRSLLNELFSRWAKTLTKRQSSILHITRSMDMMSRSCLAISLVVQN